MSKEIKSDVESDSSTSESEFSACSSSFDPLKALYSDKVSIPVKTAPLYNTVQQFEHAQDTQKSKDIIPVGYNSLVNQREKEKLKVRQEQEREIEEINRLRFSEHQGLVTVPKKQRRIKNVLTRIDATCGPLGALRDCVEQRLRIKVVTRNATGVRGVLHATLVAFDKQWNLALSDVLEVWKRKGKTKRKIPPALGTPVPQGTAAAISPVPTVTETALGGGIWECTRHLPQLLVRGEHVVLVNVVER